MTGPRRRFDKTQSQSCALYRVLLSSYLYTLRVVLYIGCCYPVIYILLELCFILGAVMAVVQLFIYSQSCALYWGLLSSYLYTLRVVLYIGCCCPVIYILLELCFILGAVMAVIQLFIYSQSCALYWVLLWLLSSYLYTLRVVLYIGGCYGC